MKNALAKLRPFLIAFIMILFGYLVSTSALSIIRQRHAISLAYAACGLIWILLGPAMFVSGWWVVVSAGRQRFPLWLGGAGCVAAGASLVAGVLTYVIPCSGPS